MTKMEYAIRMLKPSRIVDARNPYDWIDCGSIVVADNATDYEIEQAMQAANIPSTAVCVKAYKV